MKTAFARTGQKLYARARRLIPGGTQLLSKRPELFLPEEWPSYYSKARGAEVWDLDGQRYIDMTHFGVGACILGFADPDVDAAVVAAIRDGTMSTLNCPEEVELAELLVELHPWAEMVRFGRAGGEAMAVAARIARAATGRDKIAFCGYHGWHDWYLAANLAEDHALDGHLLAGLQPAGVPKGLTGTMLPFHYNRIDELRDLVARHGSELAAIVMEPAREQGPDPGFLAEIRSLATRSGAVLVFDEVTSGLRLTTGGAHLVYGVDPDIAVFAKALGNGYPMAAIIGRRAVMESAQTSFISSTSWTERIGPTAALATLRKHRRLNVADHLVTVGGAIQRAWRDAARDAGIAISVGGIPPLAHLSFEGPQGTALMTLFTQEMLDRGFLASGSFYASYAHTSEHIDPYVAALREVFPVLADASRNDVSRRLRGPEKHSGFQRLT